MCGRWCSNIIRYYDYLIISTVVISRFVVNIIMLYIICGVNGFADDLMELFYADLIQVICRGVVGNRLAGGSGCVWCRNVWVVILIGM